MSEKYSREWWAERTGLIQAFVDGDTVGFGDGEHFEELKTPRFSNLLQDYRIKPKPVGPDEYWVNLYLDGDQCFHPDKESALKYAGKTAKAIAVRYVRAED